MSYQPPRKSKSKAIADAVAEAVKLLAVAPVSSRLAPGFELQKISEREITVWPNTRECEWATRATVDAEYEVAVCVLERLGRDADEDILGDELLALVEGIGDQMIGTALTLGDGSTIAVKGFTHEPLYDRPLLESHRIFGSAIALRLFRVEDLPNRS